MAKFFAVFLSTFLNRKNFKAPLKVKHYKILVTLVKI